jgi:hypothetical protein
VVTNSRKEQKNGANRILRVNKQKTHNANLSVQKSDFTNEMEKKQ